MKHIIFFLLLLSFLYACKKEKCPEPLPGKTIYHEITGEYSGIIDYTLKKNYFASTTSDSVCNFTFFLFDKPVNNYNNYYNATAINSIDINSLSPTISSHSNFYYTNIFKSTLTDPIYVKNFYNNLSFNINSEKYGNLMFVDNSPMPDFTNKNSLSLTFSNSSPYLLNFIGLSNCDYMEAYINDPNLNSKTILPSNPSTKFYASELINTTPGTKIYLFIKLIKEKDVTISGIKIKTKKSVSFSYELTCTS